MPDIPQDTLRSLLKGATAFILVFLLLYAAAAAWVGYTTRVGHSANQDATEYQVRVMAAESILTSFGKVASAAWQFARPLLQLLFVLVIIEWLLRRVGIQIGASVQSFRWNVQAIIAIIVISAYAISELGGLGGGGMKDIALVVVGFYFGTQRHAYEVDPSTGKMRVIDEHENTIQGSKERQPDSPSDTGNSSSSAR